MIEKSPDVTRKSCFRRSIHFSFLSERRSFGFRDRLDFFDSSVSRTRFETISRCDEFVEHRSRIEERRVFSRNRSGQSRSRKENVRGKRKNEIDRQSRENCRQTIRNHRDRTLHSV